MPASNITSISGLTPTQYAKLAEVAPHLVPKGATVGTDPYKKSSPTYTWGGGGTSTTKTTKTTTPQEELERARTERELMDAASKTRMWEAEIWGKPAITGPGGLSPEEQIQTYYITSEGEIVPSSIEKKGTLPASGVYWTSPSGEQAYFYTSQQQQQPQQQQQQQYQQTFSPNYMMNQVVIPTFNELQRIWQETAGNIELAPLVAQAYSQLMSTIEQAEASIRRQFEEQMGGVDPATQAALASLRETVQQQRRSLMEEMSRRGLLQSGIWLEMEDRLARGQLTAEQQLLGNRLAALQNQLNQALQNFASARINAANQYGLEGLKQLEADIVRRQEAIAKNLQDAINLAKWQEEQELDWFEARAPYELVKETERWQQEPTVPASQQLASPVDYGRQLYEAQKAWSMATTQAEKDAAALRGQEIRAAAQKAGIPTAQVEAQAREWWQRGYR